MAKLSSLLGTVRLVSQCSRNAFATASTSSFDMIKWEAVGTSKKVALVTLNRPKALNALCGQLIDELGVTLRQLDADNNIRAIVLTGSTKAFAAGGDMRENAPKTFTEVYTGNFCEDWTVVTRLNKPIIGAVNGFALGVPLECAKNRLLRTASFSCGGCELALMCDILYAGDKAQFGLPEVNVGTIPGAGGSQHIARFAGKSTAMEMSLTGNRINASEAKQAGLVSKVFPADDVVGEAVKLGEKIAAQSPLIVQMCKESVKASFETTLRKGLDYERRMFHGTFATADRKEGMTAFTEKRKPEWKGE